MSKLYFIATNHAQFSQRSYEPGSNVIDPWRVVPDAPNVTVRRLGDHKPALISILVPSRGRPDWLGRALGTAHQTATFPKRLEFIVRLDQDDPLLDAYYNGDGLYRQRVRNVANLVRPRGLLSSCWNECYEECEGEIVMHCGDDVTFNTPGWDGIVRQAFADTPDKILFAYGHDLGPHGETVGTHGFLHRRWIETVGYFLPPLFSSDWNDIWLNDVAKMIKRHRLLPLVTEHHHYVFGKAPRDQTHIEREERGIRDRVVELYEATYEARKKDARKLKAVMA